MRRERTRRILFVLGLGLALQSQGAARVDVPPLPLATSIDTEVTTNVPFCAGGVRDREFLLSLSLAASLSNNVEVALGVDSDADGELDRTETEFAVGWDCGDWFFRDFVTGTERRENRGQGECRLDWRLTLTAARTPFGLVAKDGRTAVLSGTTSAGMFNPRWNLLRVTARGLDPAASQVWVQVPSAGLSLHVR